MWKNNWKIAIRHILKNKTSSAINITGLAIGMTACLLMLQFVSFELSYDQFHKNSKHLYRVVNDRFQNGKLVQHGTLTYSAVGRAMKEDFPDEIANYSRLEHFRIMIVSHGDKKSEETCIAVDNSFLSMFSFPLIAGDKNNALTEVNSIILTEKLAKKFLGSNSSDPKEMLGKMVVIENDSLPYKVTAICKDLPQNSHLQFDFMFSYVSLYSGGNGMWAAAENSFKVSDFWQYIQLKPGVDHKALEVKFDGFSQRHFQGNKVSGSDEKFYLQPIANAHLYSDFEYDFTKTGNASTVWGLLAIALFTIVIAWVNYINLSTARSVERAKEVGIRKMAGALRGQLIRQFLTESLLVNLFALSLALVLVYITQSAFNNLLGIDLSIGFLFYKVLGGFSIIGVLSLLLLAGILISGFYPAFVLSSFKPISVLKGKFSNTGKGIFLRKMLVTGQFAITVCLIVGALVVYNQLRFMNKQGLGYNMSQMLVVKPPFIGHHTTTSIYTKLPAFKEEVEQLAHVKGITGSNRVPGLELGRMFDVRRSEADPNTRYTVRNWGVNEEFLDVYEMKMVAGRKFNKSDVSMEDITKVILNESAAKLIGFTSAQEAVGRKVFGFGKDREVIGVVADFHQQSLRHPIEPTLMFPAYSPNNSFSIKVETADLPQTIAAIGKKYKAYFPGNLYDYYFLDEKFNEQYKEERLFGKVFNLFSGLAIFIACLGLFGLSLYTITQRTKEIGVRKVLGASVKNIVFLLSKDFIKLVGIASLIAFPAAWWVMKSWLNDFAYRINLAWWFFAIAGLLALIVALGTISFHAIRSALANPVKSLKTE